jgi:hypothetical protein
MSHAQRGFLAGLLWCLVACPIRAENVAQSGVRLPAEEELGDPRSDGMLLPSQAAPREAPSVVPAPTTEVISECSEHNWQLVFAPRGCPYQIAADGAHLPIPCTPPTLGIFTVRVQDGALAVVETVWGVPPSSGSFDLALLGRIDRLRGNAEVLQGFALAPRLHEPVQWEHVPGEGINDWLGVIHRAKLPGDLADLRLVKGSSASTFLVMVYHASEGPWYFPLQTICDLLLVEEERVFAPIYLKDRAAELIWLPHPLQADLRAFKAMVVEEARNAAARLELAPAKSAATQP